MWSIQHILHGDEGSRAPSCVFTFKSRKVWQLEKQLQSVNMQWQSLLFYLLLLLLLLPTRNFLHGAATPEYIYSYNNNNKQWQLQNNNSVYLKCYQSVLSVLWSDYLWEIAEKNCCSLIQHPTSIYCLVNQNTKKIGLEKHSFGNHVYKCITNSYCVDISILNLTQLSCF